MAVTKQKENRGGARPGAGRPRETLSVRQVKELLATAKRFAKASGKSVDDILLEFIYNVDIEGNPLPQKVGVRERIACIKLLKDHTAPRIQEGGEADKAAGPSIYLPQHKDNVVKLS